MDAFLKTRSQNNAFRPGAITCVYGRPGIGKTHFVNEKLPQHVVLDHDTLRSKQTTLDFMERVRTTRVPIVIDNWETVTDLIGVREIQGPLSHGPTVIVSHTPVQLTSNTILFQMPVMTVEELVALAPHRPDALRRAEKCRGDIRVFLQSFESDDYDTFETPREFVENLLTCPDPIQYIYKTVHEHGYVWGMIQENYTDTKQVTLETCAAITESFSLGDIYDAKIYESGAWDALMPYFVESAIVRPCTLIQNRLSPKKLRSGSLWTKYQNICMRAKKIMTSRFDLESLLTLRVYIEHEQFDILADYPTQIDTSIIDTMNHLIVQRKMKPRVIEKAKNFIRHKLVC